MTDATNKAPARTGRPTIFNQELADEICVKMMGGKSLTAICREVGMPERSTVHMWILKDKEFRTAYSVARDCQADTFAEETVEIADTPQIGIKTTKRRNGDKETTETVELDMVERSKLRVDARKWFAARVAPKRYGDRVQAEMTGAGGGPIIVQFGPDDASG